MTYSTELKLVRTMVMGNFLITQEIFWVQSSVAAKDLNKFGPREVY